MMTFNEKNPRVLIMDDEPMLRTILARVLERMNYLPVMARDSHEAVSIFREAQQKAEPFDAVILDLVIDNGPGALETLDILRQIDPQVKAVLSSGFAIDPVLDHYREHGFSAVIVKPFNTDQLLKALSCVLRP